MMTHVEVQVHSAQLDGDGHWEARELFCVAEIERFGRQRTAQAGVCSGEGSQALARWDEELEFVVGPSGAKHLKLVLFTPSCGGHEEYVAAGSLGLEPLLDSDTPHHRISVPVVDEVGKHAGEVSCTLSVTRDAGAGAAASSS